MTKPKKKQTESKPKKQASKPKIVCPACKNGYHICSVPY